MKVVLVWALIIWRGAGLRSWQITTTGCSVQVTVTCHQPLVSLHWPLHNSGSHNDTMTPALRRCRCNHLHFTRGETVWCIILQCSAVFIFCARASPPPHIYLKAAFINSAGYVYCGVCQESARTPRLQVILEQRCPPLVLQKVPSKGS